MSFIDDSDPSQPHLLSLRTLMEEQVSLPVQSCNYRSEAVFESLRMPRLTTALHPHLEVPDRSTLHL